MHIPSKLKIKIDALTEGIPLATLVASAQELSLRYRQKGKSGVTALASERHRQAYLHVRLPATYAAIVKVLESLSVYSPRTLGDVGSGPGTGLWAACEVFSSLQEAVCYERDFAFASMAKLLSEDLPIEKKWVMDNVVTGSMGTHDLILAAYSLGEIEPALRSAVVEKLWQQTRQLLVIIEPGTPEGFSQIRTIREQLIASGAQIIAPCPHAQTCLNNWCHFSARVERSAFHRHIKRGTLNFEDEKFSYIVAAREKKFAIQGRILRSPQKKSGLISFPLCSENGIQQITVTRKSKEDYRRMRKMEWGDFI